MITTLKRSQNDRLSRYGADQLHNRLSRRVDRRTGSGQPCSPTPTSRRPMWARCYAGAARTMLDADGREVPLTPLGLDPYWEAFARWSAQ
jgi:hypothetical protein